MNREIRKCHACLGKVVQELSRRLGKTSDPTEAEAILREMQEVNFRLMIAGSLLFRETTAHIDARLGEVVAATRDVNDSIKQIEQIKNVVRAVSRFLTQVDSVLDAIKILAI